MKKQNFGIDRFVVSGFSATKINEDQFNSLKNGIKYSKEGHLYFASQDIKSNIDFSYLLISNDKYFNQLKIATKKIGDYKIIPYIKLEITNNGENRNLHLQSLERCSEKIDMAIKQIRDYYGISIERDKIKFDEIEIAMDIETDFCFEDYTSILTTFSSLSSKHYAKNINKDRDSQLNAIMLKNKRSSLIIYDKKKQLATKDIHIDHNRMRFEYTLTQNRKCDKIKSSFGSEYFEDFNDKMLAHFFEKQINKDIFRPFENNIKQVKKIVNQSLNDFFRNSSWLKSIINSLVQNLDSFVSTNKITIFDIEILKDSIKKKDPKNFARNYKKIQDDCPKSFINVNRKYNEIKDKINKNISSILEEL